MAGCRRRQPNKYPTSETISRHPYCMSIRTCAKCCCWTQSTRWRKWPAGRCPNALTPRHETRTPLTTAEPSLNRRDPPVLARELLLSVITGNAAEAVAAYNAWRPSVDFTGPIDAETSALLPQLHQTLVRLELDDPLMAIFAGISRRAWYENQLLLVSLRQLLEALTNERIDCVLVGEVPLVLNYFESHKPRRIERLDIVVSSAAAQQAARLLNAAGWVSARPLAEEEIAYNHMKRFTGPNARILDLHWHFVGSAARASVDEFFWAARQTSNLQEVGACYLSPAAMLLHSLLDDHSLLASMPARWVADELALIAGTANAIDWNQIVAFALEEKLASRLRRKLELLKRFGAPKRFS